MNKIIGKVRAAIDKYKMIDQNDKIAICLSGGKDSLFLLYAMNQIKFYYPKTFEMVAITIDPCFNGRSTNYSEIKTLCSKLNIKYKVKQSRLGELIFNERKEKNPCSLCARMRRGMLHDLAKELECNKIALGHNLEDSVETFFMNLFDCGKIGCFSPVTYLSRKNLYMIRPLIFCNEAKIDAFIKQKNLPVVKSHCPANFNTNRQTTKELILKLEKKYPNLRLKIIGAISKSNIDGWKN